MIQIDRDIVIKFYEYFFKKRFNSINYKFKPSEKASKAIDNFIKKLNKHYNLKLIGEEFLWDYFVYQFNYWRNSTIESFYGKFQINFIIGDKAFKRFKDDKYDNKWVIQKSEIIKLYGLNKKDIIKQKSSNNVYKVSHEENIKKMHLNTDLGFYFCIENTTLYNHKHKACLLCIHKIDCKKALKNKYPKIYERRGY